MPPHSKKKSLKAAKAAAVRRSKKQKSVRKSKKTATKRGGGNGGNSGEEPSRPSAPSGLSGRYWAEPGRQTVVQRVSALPIEIREEIAQYLNGEDLLKLMTMAPAPENGPAYLVPQPRTRHGAPIAFLHPRAARTPMFMPSKLAMLEKKLERKGIREFVGDLKGTKMLLRHKKLGKLDPAALHDPDIMFWAVVHGNLDMVKFLHEVHGVSFQGITMVNAFKNIDLMKYLHAKGGITFTDRDRDLLLQHPTLELVEFMYSTGVVFPDDTLYNLVFTDNTDVLKYLYTKGQAFPQELLCYAIKYGNIETITFLHQTVGLLIGPEEMKTALSVGSPAEFIAYIVRFQPFPEDALDIVIESTERYMTSPEEKLKFVKYLMEKYRVKPTPRTMELVKQFPIIEAYIRGKLSSMALKQRGVLPRRS